MSKVLLEAGVPPHLQAAVLRRAAWLLEEASQPDTVRDEAVNKLMRVLSNYALLGNSHQSKGVKRTNRYVSSKAAEKLTTVPFSDWHEMTTNEHVKPLSVIWDQLCANCNSWTPERLLEEFASTPMVTVLNDENDALRKLPQGTAWSERYELAGIEIVELDSSPYPIQKRASK